jgi:hypothetical protein
MIRKGDRLENPVTGEILIFHKTSRETGGEAVLVETIVRPDGFVAAAHVHPHQTERFDVLTVEPGTPHRFWNAGDGEARFVCEVRPALEFESLIETMFGRPPAGLPADGGGSDGVRAEPPCVRPFAA